MEKPVFEVETKKDPQHHDESNAGSIAPISHTRGPFMQKRCFSVPMALGPKLGPWAQAGPLGPNRTLGPKPDPWAQAGARPKPDPGRVDLLCQTAFHRGGDNYDMWSIQIAQDAP